MTEMCRYISEAVQANACSVAGESLTERVMLSPEMMRRQVMDRQRNDWGS